jgi:glycosyltransferase involved in cell wall biosynthesis/SAM-dependent methyltransferase
MTSMQSSRAAESSVVRARPLRVLHVYSGNLFGGVERTLVTYVVRSEPSLWHCEFALCFDGQLREGLTANGATQFDLGRVRLRQPWTVARARRRLREVLASRTYDAVVSHCAWTQTIFGPVIRASGVTFVYSLHDIPSGTHVIERLAERVVPDMVVCNSDHTRATFSRMFPTIPSLTVYPAVSPQTSQLDKAALRALRASLATPDDHVVIVQASRMQEWKGHRLLLESLARVTSTTPWTCWIAGGPQRAEEESYFAELKEHARALGIDARVRFLGQRRDVGDLFAAADLFCQPNAAPEPFGVVFIEALAAGLPIVSTRMGGAIEIIDETCGVLVPPADVDGVASELSRLIGSPESRARLGSGGPSRARLLTDPTRQVRGMVDAFRAAKRDPASAVAGDGQRRPMRCAAAEAPVRNLVTRVVSAASPGGYGVVVDLGCGAGVTSRYMAGSYERYIGCDLAEYDAFPRDARSSFVSCDLNRTPYPLADASADLVIAIEAVERLENPRAFVREMIRIAKPGARIVLTTPNQLSLLSKLTLVAKGQFNAFQQAPGLYPSHITALVEEDLRRIAHECGLHEIEVHYTGQGRVPFTSRRWPGFGGRWFSDNVLLTGLAPVARASADACAPRGAA